MTKKTPKAMRCDICGETLLSDTDPTDYTIGYYHAGETGTCRDLIAELVREGVAKYRQPDDIARHVSDRFASVVAWRGKRGGK